MEDEDQVYHIEDTTNFRQVDYLWLFNNELKFSARNPPIELDDAKLSVDDFQQMRKLNRQILTEFCKNMQKQQIYSDATDCMNPEEQAMVDLEETQEELKECWADECLDEELKGILVDVNKGR